MCVEVKSGVRVKFSTRRHLENTLRTRYTVTGWPQSKDSLVRFNEVGEESGLLGTFSFPYRKRFKLKSTKTVIKRIFLII